MLVGIDASNIRLGGGVTHLVMLLAEAEPKQLGIHRVILWAPDETLLRVADRPWLKKRPLGKFGRSWVGRAFWQQCVLPGLLRSSGCQILLSPGGTLPLRRPVPSVTMFRNMLPFEPGEAERYPVFSLMRVKLRLLRRSQAASMAGAEGVIFLSQYAQRAAKNVLGKRVRRSTVIPHGIEERFRSPPRPSPAPGFREPFRLLYVSTVDLYKHQWHVAEATAMLVREGLPLTLDLVGTAYPPALVRLRATMSRLDPENKFLFYRGPLEFETMHAVYGEADTFVFASSCENLPNILFEAMAAGLPIACSRRGPMPEVLGTAGLYFDPEKPTEIAAAVRSLYEDGMLRERLARAAQQRCGEFSWHECAERTFRFIAEVAAAEGRTQNPVAQ